MEKRLINRNYDRFQGLISPATFEESLFSDLNSYFIIK